MLGIVSAPPSAGNDGVVDESEIAQAHVKSRRASEAAWSMSGYWSVGRTEEASSDAAAVSSAGEGVDAVQATETTISDSAGEKSSVSVATDATPGLATATVTAPPSIPMVTGSGLRPRSTFTAMAASNPASTSANSLAASLSLAAAAVRGGPSSSISVPSTAVTRATPTQPLLAPVQPLAVLTASTLQAALSRTTTQAQPASRKNASRVGMRRQQTSSVVSRHTPAGSQDVEDLPKEEPSNVASRETSGVNESSAMQAIKGMSMAKLAAIQTLNLTKNNRL